MVTKMIDNNVKHTKNKCKYDMDYWLHVLTYWLSMTQTKNLIFNSFTPFLDISWLIMLSKYHSTITQSFNKRNVLTKLDDNIQCLYHSYPTLFKYEEKA